MAYCDKGPIVAAVTGAADPFFDDAVRFLSAAKLDNMRLAVSTMTLSEEAGVIRKRVKAGRRCTGESGRKRDEVDAEASATVDDRDRFIDDPKANRMLDMVDDITKERPDLVHLHEMRLKYKGPTPQARRGNTYRHEGIGPIDWIHIAQARLARARAICATDKALAQIGDCEECGCLEVIIIHPRHTAGV